MLRFGIQFSALVFLLSGRLYAANYTCEIFRSLADSSVSAINNHGQAVGTIGIQSGYLREPDGKITLINYPGASFSRPSGINDVGQIAGRYVKNNVLHGFIRDPDGTFHNFEGPNGSLIDDVNGINNHGDVAGRSIHFPDNLFIRSTSGTYSTFTEPSGTNFAELAAINDSQVVTEFEVTTSSAITGGLRYPDGSFLPIPYAGLPDQEATPIKRTSIYGINNSGSVSGILEVRLPTAWGDYPFVHDLNTNHFPAVVCPGHEKETTSAIAINDKGVVGGWILNDAQNVQYGYIATPTNRNAEASLSNTSWTFSRHPVGESSGLGTIYLTNTGDAPLNILHLELTGAGFDQFSVTNNCPLPLGIGRTCNFQLMFNPTRTGPARAQMIVVDDAPDGPQVIPISGTAEGPAPSLSQTDWAFGSHAVGETSGPGTVYVYNEGTSAVHFSSIRITGNTAGDFKITQNTCGSMLVSYKTCSVTFRFTPVGTGNRTALLVFTDDAVPGQQTVSLYGGGHTP